MTIELEPFDAAKYLTDPEDQRDLIADALATGDKAVVAHALGTIARARGGIAKVATETGLGRQALHRALGKGGNPTLETLLKLLPALGLEMRIDAKAA